LLMFQHLAMIIGLFSPRGTQALSRGGTSTTPLLIKSSNVVVVVKNKFLQ
jgi:hypothetical protein